MINVNECQTQITDELLDSLKPEVKELFMDAITNIEFIRRLLAPDRKRAKDLPRDHTGKIIVDILNPHILEDMEYFRPTGNHYKLHKCMTFLRPNGNPNSAFWLWFQEEIRRCWDGYVREADGEWVTGDMYFYLNYVPILQDRMIEGTSNQADRIVDFPAVWDGTYLWFHYLIQGRSGGLYNNFEGGNHAVLIAKRGAGKSYSCAAILAKIFILGENEHACEQARAVALAYLRESLTKDGTLNKFVEAIDFCAEHTQFPVQRVKDSLNEMQWKMGYKDVTTGITKGSRNEVLGVTSKDNVEKARGKRANKFIYEEFGAFKKFIEIWMVNLPSVQNGNLVFGQAIAIGTGGSEGSDFSGALEIIYNPRGYNVYALPNYYDKNSLGNQSTVFFFGAYLNRAGHYDTNGNSDIVSSLIEIFNARYIVKYNSTDPQSLTRNIAENPITILEAIMKRENTIYPVSDLNERSNTLEANPSLMSDIYVGELKFEGKNLVFKPSTDVNPIRMFPHKNNKNMTGAIEIHEMPIRNREGIIPSGRYIAGIDPYDDDHSNTTSLGSIYVLDLLTDEIVCEYTGRPTYADEFYENCRRILLFYNALANYENNKKGLYGYFSKYNCLYLLSDNLEFLRDKEGSIKNYGNKAKGTLAIVSTKAYGRRCYRDWLISPVIRTEMQGEEVIEMQLPRASTLKSLALMKETATWDPDNNYDRHDAMIMLMLLREDKLRLLGERSPSDIVEKANHNYIGNDPFFSNNYREPSTRWGQ